MFNNIHFFSWIKIAVFVLPCVVFASESPFTANSPIHIESDQVRFEQLSNEITYQGHVVVISGHQKLYADEVIVKRDSKQNIESIHARGQPAHFKSLLKDTKIPVDAFATRIDYDPIHSVLTLAGEAKIVHQQDTFEGPLLKYEINNQKIEAIQVKNQRPKMIITSPLNRS